MKTSTSSCSSSSMPAFRSRKLVKKWHQKWVQMSSQNDCGMSITGSCQISEDHIKHQRLVRFLAPCDTVLVTTLPTSAFNNFILLHNVLAATQKHLNSQNCPTQSHQNLVSKMVGWNEANERLLFLALFNHDHQGQWDEVARS